MYKLGKNMKDLHQEGKSYGLQRVSMTIVKIIVFFFNFSFTDRSCFAAGCIHLKPSFSCH